jgi:hypothetical protein
MAPLSVEELFLFLPSSLHFCQKITITPLTMVKRYAMVESAEQQYSVVLIGSSGGGTATLGHTNPVQLLNTVHKELRHLHSDEDGKFCAGLCHAIFVSMCDGSGFDSLKKDDWLPGNNKSGEAAAMAKLYSVGFHNKNPDSEDQEALGRLNVHTIKGPLSEINAEAKRLDAQLAKILSSNHALISVSSEPTIIHANSLRSCAEHSIPVTGSGGTSISKIAELYDLPVIGAQGSVASTTNTKARGWAMGLARGWGMIYDPKHNIQDSSRGDNTTKEGAEQETTPMPSLKSILEAALPSFLFVCVLLRFYGGSVGDDKSSMMAEIEYSLRYIVPGTTCSILAATSRHSPSTNNQSSQDQSTILLASALAGILASASASQLADIHEGGSALAGLIAGASIPLALSKVSNLCVKYHITATMTNIVCGGGVGIMVGMFMHLSSAASTLSIFTGWVRCLIRWKRITIPETNAQVRIVASALVYLQKIWDDFASSPSMTKFVYTQDLQSNELPIPRGLGLVYGCIFVYGSKIGWYHSIFLPLIMLEMDSSTGQNAASLLGAIDECTLVMVCAGICTGNLLFPHHRLGRNTSLSWQALKTNILCGDFIEACYPSMEKSRLINVAAYLAAGISTEVIVSRRLLSSAYMPLPLSILMSNDRWGMIAASSIAFGISLVGTIIANKLDAITNTMKRDEKRKE